MTTTGTITLKIGQSAYEVTTTAFEITLERYLPKSANELREIVSERTGEDYSDLDFSAALVMLADFDHNVDGSPWSVDALRSATR